MIRRQTLSRTAGFASALVAAGSFVALTPVAASAKPVCDPGWGYDITSHSTSVAAAYTYDAVNNTASADSITVTATTAKTSTFTAEVSVTAETDAIFASIKATVSASASRSTTSTTGVSYNASVPAHSKVRVTHGDTIVNVTGELEDIDQNCNVVQDEGLVTSSAPINDNGWQADNIS